MAMSITVDEQGNIRIPKRFGIQPKEKLFVDKIEDTIVITKPKKPFADIKKVGNEIVSLLKTNLKDARFKDIERAA